MSRSELANLAVETITTARPDQAVRRLGLVAKTLYGVGDIANSIKMVIFGLFLFFFYTSVMGLPGTLAGIGAAIGLVWDAVIDPFIGRFSDQFRSQFGRRHLFMFIGAASLGVTFWALFSPPQNLSIPALFAWFLIASLLARLASSVFVIPYYALGAELSDDYNERTSITSIRAVCGLVGAVAAASLSFVLFFPNTLAGEDPKLNYAGYPLMGLGLGLVMSVGALIATVSTLSWRSSPRESGTTTSVTHGSALFDGFRVALRNQSFRALFLSFSLIYLGIVINSALAIHFYTYYVEVIDSAALSLTLAAFYGGAIVGALAWSRIARGRDKRSIYLVATIVTAALMVSAYFLIGPGRIFGTGDARPLMIGQLCAGLVASAFWVLPASMIADVADEDQLATGQRREGTFFGIYSFGQQLAAGLSVVVAGIGLDWFARFDPDLTSQPSTTVERIGLLFSVVPMLFLLAGAYLILRYTLTRDRVFTIQQEIRRSHDIANDRADP
jgi:glycoside/pentoside/hexuronide:cation symporter, GPH family